MYAAAPATDHTREPAWMDYHRYSAGALPGAIRYWLLDSGSLTRRLVTASDNHFKVQLLRHAWKRPAPSERRLLDMGNRDRGIVREVILRCHDQPWVFARSVIPAGSLRGHLRRLRKFSDSSLGELLFRDPSMRRQPFQIARIDGDSDWIPEHLRQPMALWGRRCRFELAGKPILVSEIFLPAFEPWSQLRAPLSHRNRIAG